MNDEKATSLWAEKKFQGPYQYVIKWHAYKYLCIYNSNDYCHMTCMTEIPCANMADCVKSLPIFEPQTSQTINTRRHDDQNGYVWFPLNCWSLLGSTKPGQIHVPYFQNPQRKGRPIRYPFFFPISIELGFVSCCENVIVNHFCTVSNPNICRI